MVKPELAKRYCNIYFPSMEDKNRWEKVAEEKGVPLSRFVYETVEASLAGEVIVMHSKRFAGPKIAKLFSDHWKLYNSRCFRRGREEY